MPAPAVGVMVNVVEHNTSGEDKDIVLPRSTRPSLRWYVGAALVVHLLVLVWGIQGLQAPVHSPIRVQVAMPVAPPDLAVVASTAPPHSQAPAPASAAPLVPRPAALPTVASLPPAHHQSTPAVAPSVTMPVSTDRATVSRRALPAVPPPPAPVRKARHPVRVPRTRQKSTVTATPPAPTPTISAPEATATQESAADPGHSVRGPEASTMQQAPAGGSPTAGGSGRAGAGHGTSGAGNTAPRLLHRPKPAYPWLARQRGFEGSVMLSVELLADGTVGNVKVLTSSGYSILDEAAADAARGWKHTPAMQNGVAVTRWARQVIDFRLDEP